MADKIMYFAYGSNMLNEQMKSRCKSFVNTGIGQLKGWQFQYDASLEDNGQKEYVGNIIKSSDETVWGVLYLVDPNDIHSLDDYEQVPSDYKHINVDVMNEKGEVCKALAYFRGPRVLGIPTSTYKAKVIKGALENKLPTSYIDKYLK